MKKKVLSVLAIPLLLLASCGSGKDQIAPDVYDVIIVGSGGGGLGAAVRLTQAGKKVLLIEQHFKVGGYMTDFKRRGYTFEVSLHAMDNLDPGRMNVHLFNNLNIMDKVKPIKTDPISRLHFPSYSIDIPADPEKLRQLIIDRYPHEKESIDDFYDATEKIDKVVDNGLYFLKGEYLTGIWECLKQPWILGPFFAHLNSTAGEFMRSYLKDEELLGFMTILTGMLGDSLDNVSGLMFAGMWNGYHRGGYYYFEGGSQSITDALEKNIREKGGEILVSTRVTKIIVEDGLATGVQTDDGRTFKCRYVVSNANALDTFFKLIDKKHLPEDYLDDLKKMKIGPSTFLVFLGVNKDYRSYYPGNTHELMINYSSDPEKNLEAMQTGDMNKMAFGIANYSKANPNAAPKGKNAMAITTIVPYDCYNSWMKNESYDKYKKLKTRLANILVKRAEKYLPGLTSHVEVMEVATPRTNERYTSNPRGTVFGWANTVDNSMWNRLSQDTPIDNLFLAGAWTLPCGGQSVVLLSGYQAAEMILDMDD